MWQSLGSKKEYKLQKSQNTCGAPLRPTEQPCLSRREGTGAGRGGQGRPPWPGGWAHPLLRGQHDSGSRPCHGQKSWKSEKYIRCPRNLARDSGFPERCRSPAALILAWEAQHFSYFPEGPGLCGPNKKGTSQEGHHSVRPRAPIPRGASGKVQAPPRPL